MPGKHAPESSASFVLSLARAGVGGLAAIGLVVAIVLIAVNARGNGDEPDLAGGATSPPATATRSASPSTEPVASEEPSEEPMAEPRVKRAKLTIEVLNGSGRSGLAARTQSRLRDAGYRKIDIGNARPTTKTTIFFRGSLRAEAEEILREFKDLKRVRAARSSTPGDAQITIVLGADHREPR